MHLNKIFKPKTVAVIGASDKKGSVGYALMDNLINSEYEGIVYPVNVKRDHVHSIKAHNSVKDIDDKIDLAIIATPAVTVPQIVRECGQAAVSGVVIISAGFQEIGKEGEKLTKEIVNIAREFNIRIIGPNCLGLYASRYSFKTRLLLIRWLYRASWRSFLSQERWVQLF